MRGLFKDQSDGTLFAAEISVVLYDPEEKMLYFYSLDDDTIQIPRVERREADEIIQAFYAEGRMELIRYDAYLNEDAPSEDEIEREVLLDDQIADAGRLRADDCKKVGVQEQVKTAPSRGLFGRRHKEKDPWDT